MLDSINQSTLFNSIMYTILQRESDYGYKVIAKVKDKDVAISLAGHLCNEAGVIRTIVIDEFGTLVSVES